MKKPNGLVEPKVTSSNVLVCLTISAKTEDIEATVIIQQKGRIKSAPPEKLE